MLLIHWMRMCVFMFNKTILNKKYGKKRNEMKNNGIFCEEKNMLKVTSRRPKIEKSCCNIIHGRWAKQNKNTSILLLFWKIAFNIQWCFSSSFFFFPSSFFLNCNTMQNGIKNFHNATTVAYTHSLTYFHSFIFDYHLYERQKKIFLNEFTRLLTFYYSL